MCVCVLITPAWHSVKSISSTELFAEHTVLIAFRPCQTVRHKKILVYPFSDRLQHGLLLYYYCFILHRTFRVLRDQLYL